MKNKRIILDYLLVFNHLTVFLKGGKHMLKDVLCHKKVLFAGGLVTGVIGRKELSSKPVRNFAVQSVASTMKLQQDAAYQLELMREEAEDLVEEKRDNKEA